jgi:hypothetical protein
MFTSAVARKRICAAQLATLGALWFVLAFTAGSGGGRFSWIPFAMGVVSSLMWLVGLLDDLVGTAIVHARRHLIGGILLFVGLAYVAGRQRRTDGQNEWLTLAVGVLVAVMTLLPVMIVVLKRDDTNKPA